MDASLLLLFFFGPDTVAPVSRGRHQPQPSSINSHNTIAIPVLYIPKLLQPVKKNYPVGF